MNDFDVVESMYIFGGHFVKALAEAFRRADLENQWRLKGAFPELWEEYTKMTELRLKEKK